MAETETETETETESSVIMYVCMSAGGMEQGKREREREREKERKKDILTSSKANIVCVCVWKEKVVGGGYTLYSLLDGCLFLGTHPCMYIPTVY